MNYLNLILISVITIYALFVLVWIIRKLVDWFSNIDTMPDDYDCPFTVDEINNLRTTKLKENDWK